MNLITEILFVSYDSLLLHNNTIQLHHRFIFQPLHFYISKRSFERLRLIDHNRVVSKAIHLYTHAHTHIHFTPVAVSLFKYVRFSCAQCKC